MGAPASESSRTGSRDLFPHLSSTFRGIHAGGGVGAWTHRSHLVALCGTTGRDTGSGVTQQTFGGIGGRGCCKPGPPGAELMGEGMLVIL